MPQVISLTGALSHAGEHRNALVNGADVADKFLNYDGLADTGTPIGTYLSSFHKRGD